MPYRYTVLLQHCEHMAYQCDSYAARNRALDLIMTNLSKMRPLYVSREAKRTLQNVVYARTTLRRVKVIEYFSLGVRCDLLHKNCEGFLIRVWR